MQSEHRYISHELRASITQLATGFLHIISGDGPVHQLPRQIEEAARAIRQHVELGGSAEKLLAQVLDTRDGFALAEKIRRSIFSTNKADRDSIECLHERALDAIRISAVREAAAVLEGNRIKADQARQQLLFGIDTLIDVEKLSVELFGDEAPRLHH